MGAKLRGELAGTLHTVEVVGSNPAAPTTFFNRIEDGRGYAEKNLRRMIQFAEAFPEEEIVVTLSRQLSWSHFSAFVVQLRSQYLGWWQHSEVFSHMDAGGA